MKKNDSDRSLIVIGMLAGDAMIFLASLALALYIRHDFTLRPDIWESHRIPFLWLFLIWMLCLAMGDFYNSRQIGINYQRAGKLIAVFLLWTLLATIFFYFSAFFLIAPKLVLAIHTGILCVFFIFWRWLLQKTIHFSPIKFAIIGKNNNTDELLLKIEKNKNFRCVLKLENDENLNEEMIFQKDIELIIPANEEIEKKWADFFFHRVFSRQIRIEKFTDFFEEVTQKIPIQVIDQRWFLENLDETRREIYEKIKRIFDIAIVLIFAVPLAVISFLIIITLAIEGKTKIFYTQTRLTKGGKKFKIYKFASMIPDAEKNGAEWSSQKGDSRVTQVGKMIRALHLDEIPQLINILKNEMSFIGPRPERPEFVKKLEKDIPFYYLRFLVKPGLTGWAQMHYPYGENIEDALHKLQYELYYIKNRSILLDFEIFLRSFALIFIKPAHK